MSTAHRLRAGPIAWHVETAGDAAAGPAILLLHGTGASAHSWRAVAAHLAPHGFVVVPDLPGHGQTGAAPAPLRGVDGMARLVGDLVRAMAIRPALVVGHSAGAAIAVRAVFDRSVAPEALVGVNAALRPLSGAAAGLFPLAARALAASGIAPWLFVRRAGQPGTVERLLAQTGSHLSEETLRAYGALLTRPAHVAGALGMMANWDLSRLDLTRLRLPVTLLAGEADRMVPPAESGWAAGRIAGARWVRMPGLGHLAQEEAPERVAALILEAWRAAASRPPQVEAA